jgi:hypothetical protein
MLHKEDFCSLYCSHAVWVAKSRTRGPGFVFGLGKTRSIEFLVGLPLGKEPLGSHRKRGGDNVKLDLSEIHC